ncbi:DNA polymerase III subunit gamma and tau [Agromyces indicus]|uniref:DNA polymerase III subunit gamma/tau n=1 Tax=Agromyces indicus TaxID=758919 RepID=A0ABU1FJH7_9MICO|nr:DNA polymerase III subunit gamma and tau [Agromyces indicus]MDR5691556.1 DNA polymerase III subunit gamma and tau [Agromyces indicus]
MVTALYRRYRPETFAEMIGQSQVTEPLMTALRTDRVNHAYLFSGPRGCGKTTSARILARCLNCAEGPTDTPCGTCPSCVELSRAGGGSLDVVEIDAASHNGVDDARDLRERAVFAPARDRYKIFILDEAHMVTPQGFNALLKLVEEPPEHVKFIFATTEPDKVLGTIRSRTHHYPFRLVPPAPMLDYVQQLCDDEGVTVEPGVLSLVVRAGGGSPRDTLSLLDQLIAGSEGSTVGYERAVALLGYTHGALLDEVVDAIGSADAAGAFAAADRVMQTGQDPRRFVEDLLERLRDLIVVAATSPEAAAAVLRGVPADELTRMAAQAAAFGPAELSRVADLVNQTLTEMTGATSPRLHLELMLARVLVPASDETERGALARVERLERRVGVTDAAGDAAPPMRASVAPSAPAPTAAPAEPTTAPTARASAPQASSPRADTSAPAASAPVEASAPGAPPTPVPPAEPAAPVEPAARAVPVGPVTLEQVRDAWPEILGVLERTKRTAWMAALTAKVIDYRSDDAVLVLGFPSQNDVNELRGATGLQSPAELLRGAIAEVLGVQVKFVPRVMGDRTPAPSAPDRPEGGAAPRGGAPASASPSSAPATESRPAGSDRVAAAGSASSDPTGGPAASAPAPAPAAAPSGPVDSWATVAIPTSDPTVAAPAADPAPARRSAPEWTTPAAEGATPDRRSATAVAERPGVDAAPIDDVPPPDDADAPPADDEPPFDAAPPPAPEPSAPAARPTRAATPPRASSGGAPIQRYGEAVVRDLLGATFLEEVEAPPARFGERS